MSQSAELDPLLVNQLRRPEPRPRKKPHPASRPRPAVLKTAAAIVVVAVVVSFATRIAAFAIEPIARTMQTGGEIRHLHQRISKQQQVNEQLRQDIAYLQTRAGLEQEARRRGWVMPGEVALSAVLPEGAEKVADPAKPAAPVAKQPAVADRIQDAVDTVLAVFGKPKPVKSR